MPTAQPALDNATTPGAGTTTVCAGWPKPRWVGLQVPSTRLERSVEDVEFEDVLWLSLKDTAAVLRADLRRHFPTLKCRVRLTNEFDGWLAVNVTGDITPDDAARLTAVCHNLTLQEFAQMFEEDFVPVMVELRRGSSAVFVCSDVAEILVEWTATGQRSTVTRPPIE